MGLSAGISYNTKILEVNLFAFAYRLFHRDFSPINGIKISYNVDLHLLSEILLTYHCRLTITISVVAFIYRVFTFQGSKQSFTAVHTIPFTFTLRVAISKATHLRSLSAHKTLSCVISGTRSAYDYY